MPSYERDYSSSDELYRYLTYHFSTRALCCEDDYSISDELYRYRISTRAASVKRDYSSSDEHYQRLVGVLMEAYPTSSSTLALPLRTSTAPRDKKSISPKARPFFPRGSQRPHTNQSCARGRSWRPLPRLSKKRRKKYAIFFFTATRPFFPSPRSTLLGEDKLLGISVGLV